MELYLSRALNIPKYLKNGSVLLLGPRRTGKSSIIKNEIQAESVYNLLESDTFQLVSTRPSLIRESIVKPGGLIVIDEIQKLPSLMDEVHTMIENQQMRFLLTGSSVRKLSRSYTKLMGGRAQTVQLHPFCFAELPKFELEKVLTYGTLPPIFLSDEPWSAIRSYVSDYIREEILAEGLSRKITQFSKFLEVAAVSHGKELNFEEIGRDSQTPARTIRDYFCILSDTLFGEMIYPFKKHPTRKATSHGKFYFFDICVPHSLTKTRELAPRGIQYGTAFEHLIYRELATYRDYKSPDMEITFYRDSSKREIDFVLNDDVGIEVKSSELVPDKELKTLKEIGSELKFRRKIVVSREKKKRKIDSIEILPIREFLEQLWSGAVV